MHEGRARAGVGGTTQDAVARVQPGRVGGGGGGRGLVGGCMVVAVVEGDRQRLALGGSGQF